MRMRTRKLIGTLLLLSVVWTLLAMALAQAVLPSANSLLAAVYYIVAGTGWVLPAMPLIAWMVKQERKPRSSNS